MMMSELGASVLLLGRNEDELEKTKVSLRPHAQHAVRVFDLKESDGIADVLKEEAARLGPFNGLVHSAGLHSHTPLRYLKQAEMDQLFQVNVSAAIALARGFRQKSVRAEKANIVYLASAAGLVGQPGISLYSASKGAIIALTKSLAIELAREHIRVNCVAPGVVETEMTERFFSLLDPLQIEEIKKAHPLGLGSADDVAQAISFLSSERMARWITGAVLTVDGGYTVH
jgi:NAD(P)-dependent dehydrogenase (short-subunit alcohol dehydrogenase family)